MCLSISFITYEGPGPTQYLTVVDNTPLEPLCADKPVTVNVLPISDVLSARVPGNSLPFDIVTFALFKGIFVVVPFGAVRVRVEAPPVSSVKKRLFLFSGSGILNLPIPSNIISLNVSVSVNVNSSMFMNS